MTLPTDRCPRCGEPMLTHGEKCVLELLTIATPYETTFTIPKTFEPTMHLRWLAKRVWIGDYLKNTVAHTLQQAWTCRETSETEWRDVEEVSK
jgi:hypothetical protein